MGGETDSEIIVDVDLILTDKEINEKAEVIFKERPYDHEHPSYPGNLAAKTGKGLRIHRNVSFLSIGEAEDYIYNLNEKWEQAEAVAVNGKGWLVGGWCSA